MRTVAVRADGVATVQQFSVTRSLPFALKSFSAATANMFRKNKDTAANPKKPFMFVPRLCGLRATEVDPLSSSFASI